MKESKSDKPSSLPIKLEASAKASANLNVNVDVPSESVGGFIDVISRRLEYWTAPGALKPSLLRLQQEQVVDQILELAEKRRKPGDQLHPLPNKFLAPFLEKASLEDVENLGLKALWAELLASSARDYKPEYLRLVSLLSEMTDIHSRIIEKCALENDRRHDLPIDFQMYMSGIRKEDHVAMATKDLSERKMEVGDGRMPDFDWQSNIGGMTLCGTLVMKLDRYEPKGTDKSWSLDVYEELGDKHEVIMAIEVLISMGLIMRFECHDRTIGGSAWLEVTGLTHLGGALAMSCIPKISDRVKSEANFKGDRYQSVP